MKKTFALQLPGKDPQRVVEGVKNDVRKYVKRERRKSLPEGVDFWDFDCKVGPNKNEAIIKHLAEVTPAIDALASGGGAEIYVEILSKPGHRAKKATEPLPESETPGVESAEFLDAQNTAPSDRSDDVLEQDRLS